MVRRLTCWFTVVCFLSTVPVVAHAESPEAESSTDETETASSDSSTSWRRYGAYGGFAVGAGLLTAGIAVDAGMSGRMDRLGDAIGEEDAAGIRQVQAESRRARTTALALYGLGGAFTIASATLFGVDLVAGQRSASSVRLNVGPSRVGLSVDW